MGEAMLSAVLDKGLSTPDSILVSDVSEVCCQRLKQKYGVEAVCDNRRAVESGGFSSLVSMVSIHNTMIRECPEHLATLYRGLHMYMRKEGDLAGRELPRRPVFFPQEDHILCWINLRLMELPFEAAGKLMPADERAAMDALEEIAERPEHKLTVKLQPGDMLLVHNFVCLHKRSSFTDDPDPEKARLMLRLWCNLPGSRVEAVQPKEARGGYFTRQPYVIRHILNQGNGLSS